MKISPLRETMMLSRFGRDDKLVETFLTLGSSGVGKVKQIPFGNDKKKGKRKDLFVLAEEEVAHRAK